jgi:DNA-binding protein H-NS
MARANGIDKLSYAELIELQDRVAEAIMTKRAEEAAALKAQIESTVATAGFSFADIFGDRRGRKVNGHPIVKYRNPRDASQTWAGRGRKPKWLVDAEAKGVSLDKLAV